MAEALPSTSLLEREPLLAELDRMVSAAASGRGSMALIAGEAGAGKTSLVRAAGRRALPRARVLIGGCDPLTTPRPLSPVIDIATEPDSGMAGLLELAGDRGELFTELMQRLKGTRKPTVLIIEDIHWADEGTLDLLRFLGRRVADSKAVVMCTYRDDEVAAGHPVRVLLGDLATREAVERLDVEPLTIDAVRAMAIDTAVDPDRLHEVTGGNAFYVTEVLAAGNEVPSSVQDAVLARLARLPSPARHVVEAVSVAPRDLAIGHALALTGAGVDDVDEATASGVLLGSGDRLRFRHELARAAVEDSISTATCLELHRRMIGLLEAETPDLARLAHHAVRAEAGDLVAEYAPKAAREAARRGAHREAVAFYEAALAYDGNLTPQHVAEIRLALGTELATVDRQPDALAQRTKAVEFYREQGDRVGLARSLLALYRSQWAARRRADARASVDEALSLLDGSDSGTDLALAWGGSGYLSMLARQHEPAMSALAKSRDLALSEGSAEDLWMADYMIGTIELVTGDAERGVTMLYESIEDAERRGDERNTVAALEMLGSGGGEARIYAPALEALARGVELGLRVDEDYLVAYNRSWLARIAFEQGRWDEATAYAGEVLSRGVEGRGSISPVTALGALGRVRVRRGDPGGREALQEALAVGEGGEMQHLWSPLCGLAELAWLEGRIEDVPVILDWVFREALGADSRWARGEVGFWMWQAGTITGPPDRAADPFALHMMGDWVARPRPGGRSGAPTRRPSPWRTGTSRRCSGASRSSMVSVLAPPPPVCGAGCGTRVSTPSLGARGRAPGTTLRG